MEVRLPRSVEVDTQEGFVTVVRFISGLLLAGAMLIAASPAAAQERSGFTFGIGGGVGGADVTCDDCGGSLGDDVEYGPAFYFNVGHALNAHVVGLAEFNFWGKSWDGGDGIDVNVGLMNITGVVQVYPSATAGFYLKGGIGMTRAAIELDGLGIDETDVSKFGFGYQAGLGWDIPVGKVAITPGFTLWAGRLDEFEGLTGWRHAVAQFSLGVTFP
jgi:hypothetical protein